MTNEEFVVRLTRIESRVEQNSKGVGNFRDFQLFAAKQLGFIAGAAKVAGIVGIVALAVFAWALSLLIPAARLLIQDYDRTHPTSHILHQSGNQPTAVQAQDSGISPALEYDQRR